MAEATPTGPRRLPAGGRRAARRHALEAFVKAGGRRLGLEIKRYAGDTSPHAVRHVAMKRVGIDLVVDGGANIGEYAQELRLMGYAGRIISFEPLSHAFERLEHAAARDTGWDCVRCALGQARSRADINVSSNVQSSSLLQVTRDHVDAAPESAFVGTESVDVVTLDDAVGRDLDGRERIFLKLDLQGYELEALRGAKAVLARTVLAEVELSLMPMYDEQARYIEVIERLEDAGLTPISFSPALIEPGTGRMLQVDGLFERVQS